MQNGTAFAFKHHSKVFPAVEAVMKMRVMSN